MRFYRAFSPAVCEPSHLSLFRRDRGAGSIEGDLEAHLLSQDVIYVGGGSVVSGASVGSGSAIVSSTRPSDSSSADGGEISSAPIGSIARSSTSAENRPAPAPSLSRSTRNCAASCR